MNKIPLHLNLDETSIKLHLEVPHGLVTSRGRSLKRSKQLCRKVAKDKTRAAFTYVAIVCDCENIQQKLPQILIVNKKICTEEAFKRITAQLPGHVVLWRRQSSWMQISNLVELLGVLAKALQPFQAEYQPILSLDACKTHLNEKVWRKAAACNILMHAIPAKATYCLQPLDCYVFALLKGELKVASQAYCIGAATADVTLEGTVLALLQAIRKVLLGRKWTHAFEKLGLSGNQHTVSERLLKRIGDAYTPNQEASFPTLQDLQHCFPKRANIPIDAVFSSACKVLGAAQPHRGLLSPRVLHRIYNLRSRVVTHSSSVSSSAVAPEVSPPLPPPADPPSDSAWKNLPRLRRLPSMVKKPQ